MDFIMRFYQLEKKHAPKRGKICFVKYSLLIICVVEQKYTQFSWEDIIKYTEDLSVGILISL